MIYSVINLYKFKCLISALNENKIVVIVISDKRKYHTLETGGEKEMSP